MKKYFAPGLETLETNTSAMLSFFDESDLELDVGEDEEVSSEE